MHSLWFGPGVNYSHSPLVHTLLSFTHNQVNLCLMKAEVTQTPRYVIKRRGEKVLLECSQDMDHEQMYWYRQDPGLGLQLIYFSYGIDNKEKGEASEGYDVSRKKKPNFSLILASASANHTSTYHCASSLATAPHSCILSAQKEQTPEGSCPSSGLMLALTSHLCLWGKSGAKE
uniref:Ig-like domain-containing protein n=1 Tax=Oryctolagus cuniculus TaxID=9986 RepID=G1U681_RABIT